MALPDRLYPETTIPNMDVPVRTAEPLYTRESVAERLAVSKPTVDRLVKNGRLKCVRIGGAVRFRPADVDALIESMRDA